MAEPTLSVSLADLQDAVGDYMGYALPYPFTASGPRAQAQCDRFIKMGLRWFYFPRLAPGEPIAHQWSFLVPNIGPSNPIVVLQPNISTYDLPDDFGSFVGELTYQPTDSTFLTLKRVGIGEIQRDVQQTFGLTGKPTKFATYPKKTDGALGQRQQVTFALIPDGVYTLSGRYSVSPNALSATNPYPYGGAEHGETLLTACLAAAESRGQDEGEQMGHYQTEFKELLLASIAVDVRNHKPENFGPNLDRSDWMGNYPWGRDWGPGQGQWDIAGVTFNGAQY